jgi:hypothetical protein
MAPAEGGETADEIQPEHRELGREEDYLDLRFLFQFFIYLITLM